MSTINRRTFLAGASAFAVAAPVAAQLRIEITGVGANQMPIAIPKFPGTDHAPVDIAAIVAADLERSGAFRRLRVQGQLSEKEVSEQDARFWQTMGATALISGTIEPVQSRWAVAVQAYDTVKGVKLIHQQFMVSESDLRLTAHRIADMVYEKFMAESGIFASRIAYVVQNGPKNYELIVADSDGENAKTALRSTESVISPTWSPDGMLLSYVSFEAGKPVVYVHDVRTGTRRLLASFKGNNSAPAFSPDGKTMALALSLGGGTHIYLMDRNGKNLRSFAHGYGIDTEPTFSPDGQYVYFTSDRGGLPQIYRQALDSKKAERVTWGVDYAISPAISPKGDKIAFISRIKGAFRVTTMDLTSGEVLVLTDTDRDESPTFAPNGQILVYATEVKGKGVLATVSLDGRVRTRLSGKQGDIREPSWGPLLK